LKTPDRMLRVALVLVVLGGAVGCGDNDNSGPEGGTPSATLQCSVLGSLCHDDETAAGHACHELGHDGTPDACVTGFSGCIEVCLGDPSGEHDDPICRALGSLCHFPGGGGGPQDACHNVGHDGDPENCRRRFDDCAERCLAAR
jgi:hypothetical protein